MPIYEYQCKACGHRLEKLQKISAAALTDCPACETPELSRLVSAAGFRLAGGGWYETDFKSGGSKKNLAGDGGANDTSKAAPAKSGDSAAPAKSGDGATA
ncbi:FmdB family zinc ribbon protein [Halomonas sp. V046]|uniref:FmdB family zinc ribbon protein n=1 Tax=Halomonas sp. V046 TaxID=3459611 RepID=UPI004044852B